jgi:hypothetical protein
VDAEARAGHPEFSAADGPIEFGFFRSDSTAIGASPYEIVALIDNWTMLVNTPCAIDADCVCGHLQRHRHGVRRRKSVHERLLCP